MGVPADRAAWVDMRCALWGADRREELADEMAVLAARDDFAVIGARQLRRWVGFVEVGARDVAEGCDSSPVGYVEGLWVATDVRRQGVARRLVEAAADWARGMGYSELASDTQLWNTASQAFHERLGFAETERIVCYRRSITD